MDNKYVRIAVLCDNVYEFDVFHKKYVEPKTKFFNDLKFPYCRFIVCDSVEQALEEEWDYYLDISKTDTWFHKDDLRIEDYMLKQELVVECELELSYRRYLKVPCLIVNRKKGHMFRILVSRRIKTFEYKFKEVTGVAV